MPSWNDGETSSEDPLLDEVSSVNPDVPRTLHDPDYCGIERHCEETCEHWEKLEKYVAFRGVDTGRKFLGCARPRDGGACSTVLWVDNEWPDHVKKCLATLWEMYEMESTQRIRDNCVKAEAYYKLLSEKEEIENKNRTLLADLSKALNESKVVAHCQVSAALEHALEMQKLLREKAENQRDELKEEKKKLEYYIADLLKLVEVNKVKLKEGEENKEKLKKLKAILDE